MTDSDKKRTEAGGMSPMKTLKSCWRAQPEVAPFASFLLLALGQAQCSILKAWQQCRGCWERASPHFSLSQLSWPQGLLELKAHVSSEDWWERRFVSAVSRVYAGDAGPNSLGEVTSAALFRILTFLLSLYAPLYPHSPPPHTHTLFL